MHTARLTLRPFALDDAAFIAELLNDPGWLRFIGDRQVRTTDDAREYLRNGAIAHAAKHGFALGAVQRTSDGALIGMCGLIRREGLDDVDLGYAFLARLPRPGLCARGGSGVVGPRLRALRPEAHRCHHQR